jgi:hypothetical protein
MRLPNSHMASLKANVKAHTDALAELRRLRAMVAREIKLREAGKWRDPNPKPEGIPGMIAWLEQIDREIAACEGNVELIRDPRWVDALAKLRDDPELVKAAVRDPKAYARRVGVKLPPEVEVELTTVAGRLDLRITGFDPLAPFELRWTDDGFSNPVADGPGEPAATPAKRPRQASSAPRKRAAAKRPPKR